jgi:hypothetical protein
LREVVLDNQDLVDLPLLLHLLREQHVRGEDSGSTRAGEEGPPGEAFQGCGAPKQPGSLCARRVLPARLAGCPFIWH